MKTIVIFSWKLYFLSLFFAHKAYGQEGNSQDTLPNKDILAWNYYEPTINLTKLKKKLVILDFWTHGCISCLKSFAKIDTLQRLFNRDIQIVLVNPESIDSTIKFFSKRRKLIKPSIPIISGDSLLFKLFPHPYVPYLIWSDSLGVIRYKAESDIFTAGNISEFLQNKQFDRIYDYEKKLINGLFDSTWNTFLDQFSYISKYIPGVKIFPRTNKGYSQRSFSSFSVKELIIRAFSEPDYLNDTLLKRPGRLGFEMSDNYRFIRPKEGSGQSEWAKNYTYNYHIQVPDSCVNEIKLRMQEDIQRYFSLIITRTKRPINCLVLIRISNSNKVSSKTKIKKNTFTWADERSTRNDSLRVFRSQEYTVFSKQFQVYMESKFNQPFEDKTGLSGLIDIDFTGATIDSGNLLKLRMELQRYGLDIVTRKCIVDVLVIANKLDKKKRE